MLLDTVTIQSDQRAEGAELPDYKNLYRKVPARIVSTNGQETWRGRQMESNINYVVQLQYDYGMQLESTQRLVVDESTILPHGHVLNMAFVNPVRKLGMRPLWEVMCRE